MALIKEWYVGYRNEKGEVRISPLAVHGDEERVREHFEYLCTDWRDYMEEEAAKEDLKHTNWATMTLAEKKKERILLLSREVSPYTIEEEAPDWE